MKIWEIVTFKARIGEATTIHFTGPEINEPTYLVELEAYMKMKRENEELKKALRNEGIAVEGEG